jgi:molecular chaperone HtpG
VAQYQWIEAAKAKGYQVLLFDSQLDSHFVNLLETKIKDSRFARVDSDSIDNLIQKEDAKKPQLKEGEELDLEYAFAAVLPEEGRYTLQAENMGENAAPMLLTQNEFMRRYKEMSALGGGMNFYGSMPEAYDVKVNMQNPLIARIWADREGTKDLLRQVIDLALLEKGMLKGKALSEFIARSEKLLA